MALGNDREQHARSSDYVRARVRAAAALTATTIFLLVVDAFSKDYTLDPVVLGLLIGGISGLLGLAVIERVVRG